MYAEAAQSPDVVREQLHSNAARVASLAERLRRAPPRAIVTCARGSSDNAATFARYLIETRLGVLTSSASPSVSSVYDSAPDLAGTVMRHLPVRHQSRPARRRRPGAQRRGAHRGAGECRELTARATGR